MNINSTVISGYQALIGQLRQQIPQLSVVNSVPPDDVRTVYLTLFPSHQT